MRSYFAFSESTELYNSEFEKAMYLQRAALFSLSSQQFSLLMKYADTLRQQRLSLQRLLVRNITLLQILKVYTFTLSLFLIVYGIYDFEFLPNYFDEVFILKLTKLHIAFGKFIDKSYKTLFQYQVKVLI